MKLLYILQAAVAGDIAGKLNKDSLAVKRQALVETIKTTPTDQLIDNLLSQAIQLGIKVLAALLIFIIGAWIIKLIKNGLKKGFARKNTEQTLASFTLSFVSIGMWILVIIISISTLGINTTSLAALLAAGGMAIGLALSGTVQNFAGGIMILVFKPFKAGDFIEALGYSGTVTDVNIVSTKLLTTDNRRIVLPNGALSNGNINNISAMPLRRVDINVSIPYGTDAESAKKALLEIIGTCPYVLDSSTPGASDPFVAVMNLGDNSVNIVTRSWVLTADYWNAYFFLNENIYTQLPSKYGIGFPFQQMDIHIKN
ncbi:MAG: mechanosensitive ion channel family protein [Bacteroidales bacterium]|nr:mechanosensitive ion channel family protein [Bacteroidales bacterium]